MFQLVIFTGYGSDLYAMAVSDDVQSLELNKIAFSDDYGEFSRKLKSAFAYSELVTICYTNGLV